VFCIFHISRKMLQESTRGSCVISEASASRKICCVSACESLELVSWSSSAWIVQEARNDCCFAVPVALHCILSSCLIKQTRRSNIGRRTTRAAVKPGQDATAPVRDFAAANRACQMSSTWEDKAWSAASDNDLLARPYPKSA
jgi:hypothetical protein